MVKNINDKQAAPTRLVHPGAFGSTIIGIKKKKEEVRVSLLYRKVELNSRTRRGQTSLCEE
jgi:hypothetical protein